MSEAAMRFPLFLLGACAMIVASPPAMAQQQFPGDPVPYTTGVVAGAVVPSVNQQFMQLDNISPQRLHNGIDVFTGPGETVVAPIRYGLQYETVGWVWSIGSDFVQLLANERQDGKVAFYRAQHIVPDPSLVVGAPITRNTPLGTVDPGYQHLHSEIFLVSSSSAQGNQFLVHPQKNAFFTVSSWNTDTYIPTVAGTIVHGAAVGSPTVFEINAYDRADMEPRIFNGIYAIRLYVDDVLVDALEFDDMRAKNGSYPPSASEYYYCTTSACTPSTFYNDPNLLRYKLSWNTQAGDHIWRIDVLDATDNLLHGDPRYGLPGRETPAVSMGGTIEDGRVRLTWRIDPADVREAGIESFTMWQAASRLAEFQPASTQPIPVSEGQGSYTFDAEAPAGIDSVWYRLTAANTVGSTLMLGETQLGVPRLVDGLQGYPNPIVDQFTIALSLAREGNGEVAIFDLGGRRVRVLQRGSFKAGVTRLVWDGRDDEGRRLANGVYLLKVSTKGGPTFTARKIALFR